MLDEKSLSVLQALKNDIKAAKSLLKGTVKGIGKSYGFVVSDDRAEYFLPPEQMRRVFPGDRVTFSLINTADNKKQAELETLEASCLQQVQGVLHLKGKRTGVKVIRSTPIQWINIAKSDLGSAKHQDIVVVKICRHPFKTGQAGGSILRCLGPAHNNRTWYSLILAQHGIPEHFSDEELQTVEQLAQTTVIDNSRVDMTALPFITIDAPTTEDMDDALYAETIDGGWQLTVAIADAAAVIKPDSVLDKAARARIATLYLPGLVLPMLPEALSNDAISLVADQARPALVFTMDISTNGEIENFKVQAAIVKCQGKLHYRQVSDWLAEGTAPARHRENLLNLQAATTALLGWRQQQANPLAHQPDYRIRVDAEFRVLAVEKEEKTIAHQMVEQAMIACNYQLAGWLNSKAGVFVTHEGFKAEHRAELPQLLSAIAPSLGDFDFAELRGFSRLMQQVQSTDDVALQQLLRKRFARARWSYLKAPHYGLGLAAYCNGTSPIRRYADLLLQRYIHARLFDTTSPGCDEKILQQLQVGLNTTKQASSAIHNRLRLGWLADKTDKRWAATIIHINNNGLLARLDDNGAIGMIDLRKTDADACFDALRMTLRVKSRSFRLGDGMGVKIKSVNAEQLLLQLVDRL